MNIGSNGIWTDNAVDRVTGANGNDSYDAARNMKQRLSCSKSETFSYDAANRLATA